MVTQMGAQEAVVIWEAPRFDGNFPIQGYRVDYKARGEKARRSLTFVDCDVSSVNILTSDFYSRQ